MPKVAPIDQRKADHIKINLEQDVRSALTTGLERFHFVHQALPELSLDEVDSGLTLFGKRLAAPILVSSMTGGTDEAGTINLRLAEAAQAAGVAMGVGSQRAAIEDSSKAATFQIRKRAPDILLFANLGAVQLNYGYGLEQCRRAVEMIGADALILHLNPLQEAVQAGGDTNWKGLAKKIEEISRKVGVPVVAKEVGWGISERAAKTLADCGVSAIDVAGAGGTSWSQVEMHRAPDEFIRELAATFVGWGIPTAESIQAVKRAVPGMTIFASGGIKDGLDIAKCVALGASLGGMAGNFLKAAAVSSESAAAMMKTHPPPDPGEHVCGGGWGFAGTGSGPFRTGLRHFFGRYLPTTGDAMVSLDWNQSAGGRKIRRLKILRARRNHMGEQIMPSNYDPQKHHRHSIRLAGYDYTAPGRYYITIVTHDRACLFGELVDGKMNLNQFGKIAKREWERLPQRFKHIELGIYVIMPNHIHGILCIHDGTGTADCTVPADLQDPRRAPPVERFGKPVPGSLPTMIRSYKSAVSLRIGYARPQDLTPIWQRNYYEHVIRNDDDYNRIHLYIMNNPLRWNKT